MSFWILLVAGVLAVLAAFGIQFGPCLLLPLAIALIAFGLAADRVPRGTPA